MTTLLPSTLSPDFEPPLSPLAYPFDAGHLRVAFFSDSLPERNGTGAYYHDLLHQITGRLGQIQIFQPIPRAKNDFLSLPMPGDPSQRLVCPNLFRIAREFRNLRPHVVVGITPGPFGMLGLYHARRTGSRFITAFHTDFEHLARIYWQPGFREVANTYLRSINRILCERSAAVTVNNSNLCSDVESLGARRIEIMGTPLPTRFLTEPLKAPDPTLKQICFAGRLAPEKNVHRVIEAARVHHDLRFVIVGDGPLREKLREQARGLGNVRFTGWLTREGLIQLLDESSLLILPSILETFGSVALEAMARGRPALVAARAGIHDWPTLEPGLFSLDADEPVAAALTRIQKLSPDIWIERCHQARAAAEALNNETIDQWVEVLHRYAFPPHPVLI